MSQQLETATRQLLSPVGIDNKGIEKTLQQRGQILNLSPGVTDL